LPLNILFAESSDQSYNSAPRSISHIPGSIIFIVWYFMSFLLVASFSALLRASLIKAELPGLLETNEDVLNSKRPVMIVTWHPHDLELFKNSTSLLDNYLAENAADVYTFVGRFAITCLKSTFKKSF